MYRPHFGQHFGLWRPIFARKPCISPCFWRFSRVHVVHFLMIAGVYFGKHIKLRGAPNLYTFCVHIRYTKKRNRVHSFLPVSVGRLVMHPKVGPPGQLLEPVNRSLDFDQDRSRGPVPSAARLARNVEMSTLRLFAACRNLRSTQLGFCAT